MKNQKMSKATAVAYRRRQQSVALTTKPSSGSHRVTETPDLHKCKTVRFSGLPLKPELAGLIEKTLQEADASVTAGGAQSAEEAHSCQKEVKQKALGNRKHKDGGHDQEASESVDANKKLDAKTETGMEEIFLEIKAMGGLPGLPATQQAHLVRGYTLHLAVEALRGKETQKDLSSFVEIDLRDKVEEKTEDVLAEDKQRENEKEPPETMPESSWLCCFPIWTKQKKRKEKNE
ncbi:uncharacterized protein LOC128350514 [Hemicordylus capensis]|uniref:uncharacterized protein LOC128350514 n=1 Tax=Hemicordylus capensis TaxID=884348 RepID=UPI00230284EC|nr:uncharacterized protein LOC128350514 [Hemicordylus capensis]